MSALAILAVSFIAVGFLGIFWLSAGFSDGVFGGSKWAEKLFTWPNFMIVTYLSAILAGYFISTEWRDWLAIIAGPSAALSLLRAHLTVRK